MHSFTEVIRDAYVKVVIDDKGYAVMELGENGLKDVLVVVKAINRATREGAICGVLHMGEVTNPFEEKKFETRAARGTTWLGGKVTRVGIGEFGPIFRVDWDVLQKITE